MIEHPFFLAYDAGFWPVPNVASIGSGWDLDAPAPVVRPEYFQGITSLDDSEVPVAAPTEEGWEIEPLPPVLRLAYRSRDESVETTDDVASIGSGWDQYDAPVVYRVLYFIGETELGGQDFIAPPTQDEGWMVDDPGPTLRVPHHLGQDGIVIDDIPLVGSGWWMDPPPVVLRPGYHEGVHGIVLDDIPLIESGWWMDPPPVVLRVPFFDNFDLFDMSILVGAAGPTGKFADAVVHGTGAGGAIIGHMGLHDALVTDAGASGVLVTDGGQSDALEP